MRNMTSCQRWVTDPLRLALLLYSIQFFTWLLFFPDDPTVPNGEPKCFVPQSFFWYFGLLALFLAGILLGKRLSHAPTPLFLLASNHYLRFIGKVAFGISCICFLIQFWPFFVNPALMELFFEPYGQNRLASMLHQSNPFGVPTVAWLASFAAAVFSVEYFSAAKKGRRRRAGMALAILSGLLLLYSIIAMSRQALLYVLLQFFIAAITVGRRRLQWRHVIVAAVILFGWVWAQGMIRMAGLSGLSLETSRAAIAELTEKYLPGELNGAFILLSYPSEPSRNWLYGTMFSRFAQDPYLPPRNLNTMNIAALWYWQAGYLSPLLALGMGWLVGRIYSAAKSSNFAPDWATVLYVVTFPALVVSLRVNSFFLAPFVVPALFAAGTWLVQHLLLQSVRSPRGQGMEDLARLDVPK